MTAAYNYDYDAMFRGACGVQISVPPTSRNRMISSVHLQLVLWFAALSLSVYYVFRFSFSHVYDFHVGTNGIDIILFGIWRIGSIRFDGIEDVYLERLFHRIDVRINPFRALRVGNRFVRKYILIKKKKGVINFLVITPANPDGFYEELKKRITSHVARSDQ